MSITFSSVIAFLSDELIEELGGKEYGIKKVLNMAHQVTMHFCNAMALLGSSLTGKKAIAHSPANRVVITKAKI